MDAPSIHPTAIVECESIGAGTRIWAYAHVMRGAKIGSNCNIGDHTFIESGVAIGNDVTIKNGCMLWDGVSIEDGAFIGPGVSFTNDLYPRSPRLELARSRYARRENWLLPTRVERGASIGARAVILPGVTIGAYAMIAAGAVVTKKVAAQALMRGNPAVQIGWVCLCGHPLNFSAGATRCSECGRRYRQTADGIQEEQ